MLPFALGACLIRFDESRTNRLRNLMFITLGTQFVGLSFYQTAAENVPLLLMHQAVAAVFATGFLVAVVRARRLPQFWANATLAGWMAAACVPGFLVWIADKTTVDTEPYGVYLSANTINTANGARLSVVREGQALLVSESPWEWAFRCDMPTVWLPRDAGDLAQVAERSDHPIAAVILTPALLDYANDSTAVSWTTTYLRLGSLWNVSNPLSPGLRQTLIQQAKLYYPEDISSALAGYRPEPFEERGGTQYTFLLWNQKIRPVYK